MTETLKSSSENTQKLQKIETELKTLGDKKTLLEKQRDGENKDDVENLEAQISQIEQKIKELLAEKQKIIGNTQVSLESARPNIEYIETSDEKKRSKAIQIASKLKSPEEISQIKIEGGIVGVLLQILTAMFGGSFTATDGKVSQQSTEKEVLTTKQQSLQNSERVKSEFDFYQLLESKEGKHFKSYEELILKWTTRIGNIDPGLLLKLMIGEGSKGILNAGPGGNNSALGLGQITNATWDFISKKIGPKQYGIHIDSVNGRYDAEAQIQAMCIYLDYCARVRNVDHTTAVIYYHMGPGKIDDNKARNYLTNNPAIARIHGTGPVSVSSYKNAAREYYLST